MRDGKERFTPYRSRLSLDQLGAERKHGDGRCGPLRTLKRRANIAMGIRAPPHRRCAEDARRLGIPRATFTSISVYCLLAKEASVWQTKRREAPRLASGYPACTLKKSTAAHGPSPPSAPAHGRVRGLRPQQRRRSGTGRAHGPMSCMPCMVFLNRGRRCRVADIGQDTNRLILLQRHK